jgi:hypothetical protein
VRHRSAESDRTLRAGNPDGRKNREYINGALTRPTTLAEHKSCLADRLGHLKNSLAASFDLARDERTLALFAL